MKRFSILLAVVFIIALMLTGVDFLVQKPNDSPVIPKQCGYTIIEAGKALNCHGDTISIGKIHAEVLASR